MKKYVPVLFILILWAATEAVYAPMRLVPVAGFAAAALLLSLRYRAVPWSAALLITAGMCVYDLGFLRYAPVLLLMAARHIAPVTEKTKKKNAANADGAYTAAIAAAALSAGIMIYDLVFASRNPQTLTPVRQYWWLAGAAFCLIAVLAAGRAGARRQKGIFFVYGAALFCILCGAVGFLCNSVLYRLNDAVFPWFLFLSAAAAQPDKMLSAAAERIPRLLVRFTAKKEDAA